MSATVSVHCGKSALKDTKDLKDQRKEGKEAKESKMYRHKSLKFQVIVMSEPLKRFEPNLE